MERLLVIGSVLGGRIMEYSYTLPYFIAAAFYAGGPCSPGCCSAVGDIWVRRASASRQPMRC